MVVTDYTIEWANRVQATLSWDRPVGQTYSYNIYIDGLFVGRRMYPDETILVLNTDIDVLHSIDIFTITEIDDDAPNPSPVEIIRPNLRWKTVPGVFDYRVEIYLDSSWMELHRQIITENESGEVLEWQVDTGLNVVGFGHGLFRVLGYSPFGAAAVPLTVAGDIFAYPPAPSEVDTEEESASIFITVE